MTAEPSLPPIIAKPLPSTVKVKEEPAVLETDIVRYQLSALPPPGLLMAQVPL